MGGLLAVAVLGMTAGAAFGMGSEKVPLTLNNVTCDGSPAFGSGSGPGTGFAIINKAASGKLIANVVLTGATPATTYNIRLIQVVAGDTDCGSYLGPGEATLTTDALGNGQANYQEPVLPGASRAFVDLNNAVNPGVDYFVTQVVTP